VLAERRNSDVQGEERDASFLNGDALWWVGGLAARCERKKKN